MKAKSLIWIINGPNLNLLGKREPSIYSDVSFDTYLSTLQKHFIDLEISCFQSNIEGELVNKLQESLQHELLGIVLNAAAYTHTSVAIGDAIAAITTPVVEVHISNVFAREEFRHLSYISKKCIGSITGFGLDSYRLGIEALRQHRS